MIPAASHPRIDHQLCLVSDDVSKLPTTTVPTVSVAPTNKWNVRRVFLPTTALRSSLPRETFNLRVSHSPHDKGLGKAAKQAHLYSSRQLPRIRPYLRPANVDSSRWKFSEVRAVASRNRLYQILAINISIGGGAE